MDPKLIEDFETELAAHSAALEKAAELCEAQAARIKELEAENSEAADHVGRAEMAENAWHHEYKVMGKVAQANQKAVLEAGELLKRQDAQIKELHAAYENETLSTMQMANRITELEGCLRTEAMRIENLKSDRDEWRRNFLRKHAKCEDWKRTAPASESQREAD